MFQQLMFQQPNNMTEIYTFQGQQYNVHSSRLNEFMEKFPEATKQENVNVETVEPSAKDYAVDLFTSIPQSGLKALGGIVNYLEAGERVVLDYVYKDLTPEEKAEKIAWLEENQNFGFLSEGDDNIFSNAGKYFDKFDVEQDKTLTEDLIEATKEKDPKKTCRIYNRIHVYLGNL